MTKEEINSIKILYEEMLDAAYNTAVSTTPVPEYIELLKYRYSMWTEHNETDDWDERETDVDNVIQWIEAFKESVKEFENERGFTIKYICDGSKYDHSGVDFNGLKCTYFTLKSKKDLYYLVNRRVKEIIEATLKPESAKYPRGVDCKLLELFMTDLITWEKLQQLVYSDCNL